MLYYKPRLQFCSNIPLEIQLEIIKRIPHVKSLLRFRSVSKQWKSFIDSSDFIASYGSRHTQPHRLLLRYQVTWCTSKKEISYDSFIDDVSFPLKEGTSPYVPWCVYRLNEYNVIGSSCGLWSFHGYIEERIVIWNPSIRKLVRIVVPRVRNTTYENFRYFAFGVCPSTYDPTIVGIWYSFYENVKNKVTDQWKVHIFTLSSKTWKMIQSSNLPRESINLRSDQVAIDRFIFWVAYDRIVGNAFILSFDLISQEFKEIHLPDSITNHKFQDISLSELNESLVVCAYTNDEVNDRRVYGLWMMGKEGGIMASFTKLFNIKIHDSSSTMTLLGFRKSGQPIIGTGKKDQEFIENFAEEYAHNFAEDIAKGEAEEIAKALAKDIDALEVYEPCSDK